MSDPTTQSSAGTVVEVEVEAEAPPASPTALATALADVVAQLPGGGEVRDGQRAMAQAVESAIGSGRHLVVQAGTGTGKTLAYLLPAVRSHGRTVIATATTHETRKSDLECRDGAHAHLRHHPRRALRPHQQGR